MNDFRNKDTEGPSRWISNNGRDLVYVNDAVLPDPWPANCDQKKIVQSVVKTDENYFVYSDALEARQKENSYGLQLSFRNVHEMLRLVFSDPQVIQKLNVLFHSKDFFALNEAQLIPYLTRGGIFSGYYNYELFVLDMIARANNHNDIDVIERYIETHVLSRIRQAREDLNKVRPMVVRIENTSPCSREDVSGALAELDRLKSFMGTAYGHAFIQTLPPLPSPLGTRNGDGELQWALLSWGRPMNRMGGHIMGNEYDWSKSRYSSLYRQLSDASSNMMKDLRLQFDFRNRIEDVRNKCQ